MNKVKLGSNMYPFLNELSSGNGYTWNPIRGTCPHQCSYCYVPDILRGNWGILRLDEKALNESLGAGNYIFVGSSTDMWAREVPDEWIGWVLSHCRGYEKNTYLFQSKNPFRFSEWKEFLPQDTILGCTIESNRDYPVSQAPTPGVRAGWMQMEGVRKMISVEPVMDFDNQVLVDWIEQISPEFVSVGADSKGHGLPEPPADKLRELLEELVKITEVRTKDNLRRLLK